MRYAKAWVIALNEAIINNSKTYRIDNATANRNFAIAIRDRVALLYKQQNGEPSKCV